MKLVEPSEGALKFVVVVLAFAVIAYEREACVSLGLACTRKYIFPSL